MSIVSFTVYGRPQPQGSMRAFIPKGWKRPVLTSDNKKLKPWRQQVAASALVAKGSAPLIRRPAGVSLHVHFFFLRPRSLPKCVIENSKRPDVEKLVRSVCDALTGICYEDDSQVVKLTAIKAYGEPARTEITVGRLDGSD